MDKTEKFIKKGLSSDNEHIQYDLESIIAGTHISIKKRAVRRKVLYSSPVALVLLFIAIMVVPETNERSTLPGSELIVAGWEYSWTESQDLNLENSESNILYDQSVDYLIDENYYTYVEDADALLDEIDLEALLGYLKEA
jgi:hypothetical protein